MGDLRKGRSGATLRWLHRWIGLTLGIPFVLVSLSGTLLLFQDQYFRWAHGELFPDGMSQEVGSIDRWVANARAAVPTLGEPVAIWPPHTEHNISDAGMLVFGGLEPGGLGNMGFAGVLVAPATGEVLGVIDIDRSPAYAPLFLHRDFWAGQWGQIFLGIVSVALLLMIVIGAILWWPQQGRVRRKLSPRPWRQTFTRARPLHDWTGIWILPLLFVLTATGLYLVRPGWVSGLLPAAPEAGGSSAMAAPQPEPTTAASSDTALCLAPIGFDAAIAKAKALAPSTAFHAIYPGEGSWEIVLRPDGAQAYFDDTHVLANLDCGIVAIEATPESRPARETAEMWLASVHDGSAAGTVGRLVVAAAGIVPLALLWSGVLMWWRARARNLAAATRLRERDSQGLPAEAAETL